MKSEWDPWVVSVISLVVLLYYGCAGNWWRMQRSLCLISYNGIWNYTYLKVKSFKKQANKKSSPLKHFPLLVSSFSFSIIVLTNQIPLQKMRIFPGEMKEGPCKGDISPHLGALVSENLFHNSTGLWALSILWQDAKWPWALEASPDGSLSPSILAPSRFIGTICALSMSDINTCITRVCMVVGYCLCSHSPSFKGIIPFTHHVVQEVPQNGALVRPTAQHRLRPGLPWVRWLVQGHAHDSSLVNQRLARTCLLELPFVWVLEPGKCEARAASSHLPWPEGENKAPHSEWSCEKEVKEPKQGSWFPLDAAMLARTPQHTSRYHVPWHAPFIL